MDAVNRLVVHRDINPRNIFHQAGLVKIADFGIAKYVGEVTRTLTFKDWGTMPYVAPERVKNESVDPRSDQYSMGIVFHEMATLRRPFEGSNDELAQMHLFVRPPRITQQRPEYSERLASLVARMLEKQVDRRFPDWAALAAELDAIGRSGPGQPGAPADDTIARRAAEQVERVRGQELAEQRAAEEALRAKSERSDVVAFWATEFFGKVRGEVERLNTALGGSEIKYTEGPARGRDDLRLQHNSRVIFLRSELKLGVGLVDPDVQGAEGALGWGIVRLTTPKRIWVANLLLVPNGTPYGQWLRVEMEMSGIARSNSVPDDEWGGRYDVLGGRRLVLALNRQGLLYQRSIRNVMSHVNYREQTFSLEAVLPELFSILVEDANEAPPAPRQRPPMQWGPRR